MMKRAQRSASMMQNLTAPLRNTRVEFSSNKKASAFSFFSPFVHPPSLSLEATNKRTLTAKCSQSVFLNGVYQNPKTVAISRFPSPSFFIIATISLSPIELKSKAQRMTEHAFERSILVTGGAGFIGSNVLKMMVPKYPQYKFVNLDKLDSCACPSHLESISGLPNYKFVKGSILSPDLVAYLLTNEGIDTVLHFAAQTHVDNSFGNPLTFTENNVMGTHVLLEEARVHRLKLFIHVSTDEVYGPSDETCTETKTVLNPTNPYSATKMAAEALVKSYAASFNIPVIITRGNNVYGPGQYPEKLIPKFICRLIKDIPCCIHGTGRNVRNFLFVDDVAEAFDMILHRGEIGSVYNIGTSFCRSNLEVAKDLIEVVGLKDREAELIEHVEDRAYNDHRYNIDTTRLEQLGWRPQTPWKEGLKRTADWYRGNMASCWGTLEEALKPHPTAVKTFTG